MYEYNYLKKKLWIDNLNINNLNNLNLNPYLLNKFIKNEYKKIINNKYFYLLEFNSVFINFKLNNILLTNKEYINQLQKIEYSNFLIVYLLKYISFVNKNNFKKIDLLLSKISYFLKKNNFKLINKKQSYNFCKYSYKCKCYYNNNKCKFDHYCYNKLCIDIQNLKNNFYNLSKENIKKYIVTIHFVIEHIYDEYFMYRYINNINI